MRSYCTDIPSSLVGGPAAAHHFPARFPDSGWCKKNPGILGVWGARGSSRGGGGKGRPLCPSSIRGRLLRKWRRGGRARARC